ncbi:hypothetical protein [Bradyrhizobium liaoningense]
MQGSQKRFRATQTERPRRNSSEFHREEFRSATVYDDRLLFSRKYVMRLLDISYDTIERLEAAGRLRRVQFSTRGARPGRTTKVLYRREEILQLIDTFTIARSKT